MWEVIQSKTRVGPHGTLEDPHGREAIRLHGMFEVLLPKAKSCVPHETASRNPFQKKELQKTDTVASEGIYLFFVGAFVEHLRGWCIRADFTRWPEGHFSNWQKKKKKGI